MKKLLILLLFPLMMFAQDTTLIGDVDCSGEVNAEDASLILQFVTNVIDSLPCEANLTGLTPEQLQEIINIMDEQLNINYSGGGSNNYPIMISSISDYPLEWGDALMYCDGLEEDGYSDWFLPNSDQLAFAMAGGCDLPDQRTTNQIWTTSKSHQASDAIIILSNDNGLNEATGYSLVYCRCVRFGEGEISDGSNGSTNSSGSSIIENPEQTITMISPIYDSATFPEFTTWDTEEGNSIYYADAFRFCEQLNYNDYDDWRLPSLNEMHNYVKENPQSEFIIPNHNTDGWTNFWLTANEDGPSSGFTSTANLTYAAPIVHISGPTHQTLPNQILFYGAMGTYSMINCFCVR